MNSAGYRYAASDQAFYIPAVVRHLEPADFPRDAPLIDAQARVILSDDVIAAIARATRVSLQWLFAALYVVTLGLLFVAIVRIGRRLYRTQWAVVAFAAGMTLRHSIAKTGANTLEAYFHPRVLSFAFGLLAVDAFMARRDKTSIALLIAAAIAHPTTALWFAVWLFTAAWFARPTWRKALGVVAIAACAGALFVLWRGPLAGHLSRMDAAWMEAISDKDYLFPLSWPLDAWFTNLVAIPIVLLCWRARRHAGLTVAGETPLVIGAMGLVVLFVLWLPFDTARIAIAVELQLSRVFWLLDVLATMYLVWWLVEYGRVKPWVTAVIVLLSLARGTYSMFVEFPDRPIFAIDIRPGDWRDAMAWARTTDPSSGWLADPIHAAKYGSSIRAVAYRDVLLERVKDRALAMYDRDVALRVDDRERALHALAWDTPDGARALARRYGLDYLVIDRPLDLPLAHRSGSLFIYRIR